MNLTMMVFSLYFIAIIGITFYGTRKVNRAMEAGNFSDEFFVGGRKIGPVALAILIAAGICSTGTFVGGPGLAASLGPGYGLLLGASQVGMAVYVLGTIGKKFAIIGRRTNSQTYIDIFSHRFEHWKPLIFVMAIAIMIMIIVTATAEFIGGSRVIEAMSGIPFIYSLLAFGILITAYTALGGMQGVSLVGVLQGFVMTVGTLILVFGYFATYGSVSDMVSEAAKIDIQMLTPSHGTVSLYVQLNFFLSYGVAALGQPWGVQPALAYKDMKTGKTAMVCGIIFCVIWTMFLCNIAGYPSRIATPVFPLNADGLPVTDVALPNLAIKILPPALSGIVLAAIAGAGQSTIAALFILASGSVVINIYKAFIKPDVSQGAVRKMSIVVTSVVGIMCIFFAIVEPPTMQTFLTYSVGCCAASFIPLLALGLYWPRANKYGALAGIVCGMVLYPTFSTVDMGMKVIMDMPSVFATIASTLAIYFVSVITPKPSREALEVFFGER